MPALVDLRVCYQNYDSCTNLCALSIMVLTKRRAYTLSLNLCTTRAIWILIFLFALCNCTFVSITTQDCIRFLKIAPLHDILTFIVLVQTGGLTREVVVLNSWTIGSREMFRFLTLSAGPRWPLVLQSLPSSKAIDPSATGAVVRLVETCEKIESSNKTQAWRKLKLATGSHMYRSIHLSFTRSRSISSKDVYCSK